VTPLARASAGIESRVAAWSQRRHGPDVPPFALRARRLYILPSRGGMGFVALLVVMLIAGLNYTNSLALLLTFVLGSFMFVAMFQCHRTLLGLEVLAAHAELACAGQTARVTFVLGNAAARARAGVTLRLTSDPRVGEESGPLAPGESVTLQLPVTTPRRGRHPLPRIQVETRLPFALFRCWTWLHVPLDIVVYPQPLGSLPPPAAAGEYAGSLLHGPGEDELADLRAFRAGDSPRQVAWKAYARGAPLLVKEYRAAGAQSRRFSFDTLHGLGIEARLSQLTRWVLDAEARGEEYALQLPATQLAEGAGREHRDRCLTALALHGVAK
jgi:uncharacterized protein (DUF58 family)